MTSGLIKGPQQNFKNSMEKNEEEAKNRAMNTDVTVFEKVNSL